MWSLRPVLVAAFLSPSLLLAAALAGEVDAWPTTGPRAAGITHRDFPAGLDRASFNNYVDNNSTAVPDERRFLKVRLLDDPPFGAGTALPSDPAELTVVRYTAYIRDQAAEVSYRDALAIEPRAGKRLRFCVYLHNNGASDDPAAAAQGVRVRVEGFARDPLTGRYATAAAAGEARVGAVIAADNAEPGAVGAAVRIESRNPGRSFTLEAIEGAVLLASRDGSHRVDLAAEDLFGEGAPVGTASACERDRSGRFAGGEAHVSWVYFDAWVVPGPATVAPVEPQ